MKIRLAVPFILLFFAGCAAFKELEPIPPVQSNERGFVELRNDKENFVLKKSTQYFIKFPRPADTHFYLVLHTSAKRSLHNYFTATFHDGEGPLLPIPDESVYQDTVSVFAMDTSNIFYYWVIDTVYQDLSLHLEYRYVPQWRYTVENKYDEYRRILGENSYDRHIYEAMGPQFDFNTLNAASEQQKLRLKNAILSNMNDAMVKLEKIFPANIATSTDSMYLRYVSLSEDTKDELRFQSEYDAILTILQRENETKGNFNTFMERAPEFEQVLSQKGRFRAPILEYLKSVYLRRLSEALPSYDAQLQKREDLSSIELTPQIADVEKLYSACGQTLPQELQDVLSYVNSFNALAQGVSKAEKIYETEYSARQQKMPWPDDSYYPAKLKKLEAARIAMPENKLSQFERFAALKITSLVSERAAKVISQIGELEGQYRKAADVVQRINAIKPQKNYKGIVQILRENRDLPFVLSHYTDIDALLLKSYEDKIRDRIDASDWREAEQGLSDLLNEKDFLNPAQIAAKKLETVKTLETELFERVKKLTSERVDAFVKKNEMTIDNVAALYADSSFLPLYVLTFSADSPGRVIQKRRAIDDYLRQVKQVRFPENAIHLLYKELTRAPREQGVEKAKAILAHAKFYKGQDKTVRNIIDEIDPMIAKPLMKAKEYRRVFVIPTNETAQGSNEYVFRINVTIPSEAKFPVYDLNIKVPQEVAQKAGSKQWFTDMLLNKKVIKTEGHMRVTAPTADNEYEAQVTPVQMSKDRDNIVEVRFKYPQFKLFEVSVMAQVPIIRKN